MHAYGTTAVTVAATAIAVFVLFVCLTGSLGDCAQRVLCRSLNRIAQEVYGANVCNANETLVHKVLRVLNFPVPQTQAPVPTATQRAVCESLGTLLGFAGALCVCAVGDFIVYVSSLCGSIYHFLVLVAVVYKIRTVTAPSSCLALT
jgi:hypothetical protein